MARKAGFGVIEFGDTPAVVGELRSWRSVDEPAERDTTIMGSGLARREPGSKSQEIEAECYFVYEDAGQALVVAQNGNETAQTVSLYPWGNSTSEYYLTGNAFVMRSNAEGPEGADGSVQISFRFTSDDAGFTWQQVP